MFQSSHPAWYGTLVRGLHVLAYVLRRGVLQLPPYINLPYIIPAFHVMLKARDYEPTGHSCQGRLLFSRAVFCKSTYPISAPRIQPVRFTHAFAYDRIPRISDPPPPCHIQTVYLLISHSCRGATASSSVSSFCPKRINEYRRFGDWKMIAILPKDRSDLQSDYDMYSI